MKFLKVSAIALLCMTFASVSALALKIPASPAGRVSDYAQMLSADTVERLDDALESYEDKTGVEIAVAIFPSLEGESLEDFSIHLAEKWKIGRKGKDNGVIMLIFKQERKIRIEVGYGLESELPDAIASMIIRNVITPYFRNGDYDGGVIRGVSAIMKVLSGNGSFSPGSENRENPGYYTIGRQQIVKIALFIVAAIAALFIIDLFRYVGYSASHRGYYHRYSFFEWLIIFSITLALIKLIFYMALAGRGGFGGGRGGWGGGGGSFSGGGGSFGGGGASGSW
jgi:uncharacterized protein